MESLQIILKFANFLLYYNVFDLTIKTNVFDLGIKINMM